MTDKSTCCNAPITVSGGDESTNFYVCTKCDKACDVMSNTTSEFRQCFFRVGTDIPLNSADDQVGKSIGKQMLRFVRATEEAAKREAKIEVLQELLAQHTDTIESSDEDYNGLTIVFALYIQRMLSSIKDSHSTL